VTGSARGGRPTAVVTGASRGIGRAIARRLAADHHVVALARSAEQLGTLAADIRAAGGECTPLAADITDGDGVARALAGVDADVVVNNAGIGHMKPFMELTPGEWQEMVDVNLTALFHVTRAVLPRMMERKRGHVVIIGSIASRSAFVGGTGYGATKHAVMGFAESLMLEVREHDVKVTVVNPGSVRTDFGRGALAGKDWALTPDDVAEAVAYAVATPPNVLVHRLEVRANHPRK
jgi:3-hydroxy acid dehydrogenase/malonic semialdehyde reductase